jgi:phosphate transport system substrate-binding protein
MESSMKRLLIGGLAALHLAAAAAPAQTKITIKGSDTMVILAQRWAEHYMRERKDVVIQVTGGGSGTGISALINGTTDICNASRPMKESEREKLKEKSGSRGVEIKCAVDALSVYVHEKNPVRELSLDQIRDVYLGIITNWKQLGGADKKIVLYSRENNSGTYVYFKDEVLGGKDFAPNTQHLPGTSAVVNAVSKDPWGIGYGGAAYGKGIREVKVKKEPASAAFAPTLPNVRAGDYPISRFLYMYTRTRPTGPMKEFIDWVLGDDGQKVVNEVGYFPLR